MPELESSRPSVTALNSIGLVGVCTIWDNKRVNGLLIYGKNIDCQLSPRVDSSYYYSRVHLSGKKKRQRGFLKPNCYFDICDFEKTSEGFGQRYQRIIKSLEACNFLNFEIFYIEMKHPNCYITLHLTLLDYNAHNLLTT